MAATNFTPIQLYRTTTASAVPTAGNLADGELAINLTDERLYFKNAGGTVKLLASNAGAGGDVVAANANAFTGANTFYNTTGQTFGTATATQDGFIIGGRAGGSSTYRITFTPGTLTANRTLTFPDATDTVAVLGAAQTLSLKTLTGSKETRVTMGASNIDLDAGNWFTRTISGTTTLTVSNVPASGTAASFILDLTNGGSATVNWWSNVRWAGGTPPTLTAAGRDVLGFYTYDAGSNWTGLLLGKDVK
jgi:hypothetical protein